MKTSVPSLIQNTAPPSIRTPSGLGPLTHALGALWSRFFRGGQLDLEAQSFQDFMELAAAHVAGTVVVSPTIRAEASEGVGPAPLRVYELRFLAIGRSGRSLRFADVLTRAPMSLLVGRGSGRGRARAALDGLVNAIYAAHALRTVLPWAAITVAALGQADEDAVLEVAAGMHIAPRERYAETAS